MASRRQTQSGQREETPEYIAAPEQVFHLCSYPAIEPTPLLLSFGDSPSSRSYVTTPVSPHRRVSDRRTTVSDARDQTGSHGALPDWNQITRQDTATKDNPAQTLPRTLAPDTGRTSLLATMQKTARRLFGRRAAAGRDVEPDPTQTGVQTVPHSPRARAEEDPCREASSRLTTVDAATYSPQPGRKVTGRTVQAVSPGVRQLTNSAVQTEPRVVVTPRASSSYTCQNCGGQEKARPHLFATCQATFNDTSTQLLDVTVFIQDERLKNSDVRRATDHLEEVELLETCHGTRLYVRLRLPENSRMRHCLDDRRRPLFSIDKSYDFHRLLTCRKCQKKQRQAPFTHRWMLQPVVSEFQGDPAFHAVIDVCHLLADQEPPGWQVSRAFLETVTTLAFHVKCPVVMSHPEEKEDRTAWETHLLSLKEGQLKRVARALGIPDAQLLSLKQRSTCSREFRRQLRQVCLTQGTTRTGLFIPVIAALASQPSKPHTDSMCISTNDVDSDTSAFGDTSTSLVFQQSRETFNETVSFLPIHPDPRDTIPKRIHGQHYEESYTQRPAVYLEMLSSLPAYSYTRNSNTNDIEKQHSQRKDTGFGYVPETEAAHDLRPSGLPVVPFLPIPRSVPNESVRMSYLKTFDETDPPPSYVSHFPTSNTAALQWPAEQAIEHTDLSDMDDCFQTATGHVEETGTPCREWRGDLVHQSSTDAISLCRLVGNTTSQQSSGQPDQHNLQDLTCPEKSNMVTISREGLRDGAANVNSSPGQTAVQQYNGAVRIQTDGQRGPNPQSSESSQDSFNARSPQSSESSLDSFHVNSDQMPIANEFVCNSACDSDSSHFSIDQFPLSNNKENLPFCEGNKETVPHPPCLSRVSDTPLTHLGQLERRGAPTVVNDLTSPLSMFSSGQSSAFSSVCMEFVISLSGANDSSQESVDSNLVSGNKKRLTELLMKTSEILPENLMVGHGTTATQTEALERPVSSPVVCSEWNACFEVTHDGDSLQTEGSDVLLHVPPGAVQSGESVNVLAAMCASVDHIRRVLQLPEDEEILSPLAEYHAGNDLRFQRPVFITLPHALPLGYDVTQVNVYRVSRTDEGIVAVTKLCHKETQPDHSDLRAPWPEGQQHPGSPTFCLSSPGQVRIMTDCFSGYVCTYSNCGLQQESPVLHAMVCSSNSKDDNRQQVIIYTYIWDDRLDIKDFQTANGIGTKMAIQTTAVLPLMEDINNSKLCLCLRMLGEGAKNWGPMRSTGPDNPSPFQKSLDIKRVLSCDNEHCQARKMCSQPKATTWKLETVDECPPNAPLTLRCDVLVAHVPSFTSLSECFQDRETMETLYVQVEEESGSRRREDSRRSRPPRQSAHPQRFHTARQRSARQHNTDEEDDSDRAEDITKGVRDKRRQKMGKNNSVSSEGFTKVVRKVIDPIPNNKYCTHNDKSSSSAESSTEQPLGAHSHNANERAGKTNKSDYNSSQATQKAMPSRKQTQRLDTYDLTHARGSRLAQIDHQKEWKKTMIGTDGSYSDMPRNFNPYGSESESDTRQKAAATAGTQHHGDDDDDNDDNVALSENHYEEIGLPPANLRPTPSLPGRPGRPTEPVDPSPAQTHSLPTSCLSRTSPPCLNVGPNPYPSQQSRNGDVDKAAQHPSLDVAGSNGTSVEGEVGQPSLSRTQPSNGRRRRSSVRKGHVTERTSEDQNKKRECCLM